MPHHPEDDWTRPLPRTPRNRRPDPVDPDLPGYLSGDGTADETQQIDYRELEGQESYDRGGYQDAAYAGRYDGQYADGRYADDRYADGGYADDGYADSYDEAYDQPEDREVYRGQGGPPPAPGGRPPGGPPPGGPRRRRKRPRYGLRRFMVVLLVLVLAYVGAMIWAVTATWNSIDRVPATPTSADRPAAGSGSNFVLVGTDSRDNLTRAERNELVAGHSTEGARADTIMVLHLPDSGEPTLLSLPRDSYVEIPGQGENKINAAYSIGGPPLLVDTIEQSTGLRIDGYLEIGFGGFVEVVKVAGGVHMCLDEPVVDEKTKLDLPAGCQDLAGAEALNYVRMRYSDPRGDLGRVERQREFLSALVSKMATPQTILVPWRLHDVGTATGSALAIGEDTSMWETIQMALAMRKVSGGNGQSVTVPIENANYSTPAGSAVLWDTVKAEAMFEALRNDEPLSIEP
ncbi:LCP family protein [Ornithinicoccus hortensis]|uniref:LCP family protein n=1 Tax=Ornithinicoccus hortensis TaxID=82346 RepID=UPI001E3F5EC5|nr:LCP family protein [Ornithinicoccus hortensis]